MGITVVGDRILGDILLSAVYMAAVSDQYTTITHYSRRISVADY
jgi:hypothetical protein